MVNTWVIEDYILKNGLQKNVFASMIGVSNTSIHQLFKKKSCSLETLVSIADIMKVSIDTLLDRNYVQETNKNVLHEPQSKFKPLKNYSVRTMTMDYNDFSSMIDTIKSQQRTIENLSKR